MQRIPPSVQMREALLTQLTTRGPKAHPLRQFVARATELMLQVGLEEQVEAFFGRGYYERGSGTRPGYRNGYGEHTLKTEAGPLALRPPKVRATAEPFAVQLPAGLTTTTPELRALVTRASVRGLSDRDVEGLSAKVFGGALSKSVVSRATQSLQADFDAWRTRDLSDLQVVYLFLDGQYHAVRPPPPGAEAARADRELDRVPPRPDRARARDAGPHHRRRQSRLSSGRASPTGGWP